MLADNESGAGYPIDQQLREYLLEYNDRALGHGLLTMPQSFNVFEGFYELKSIDPFHFFAIRSEKDHLFSLSDFLDFVTSADHRPDAIRSLMQLPNGVIYNFTPVGDIRELAFLNSDSSRFLIAGFTMIRHEEQLHWAMIGGPICNLADETRKLNIVPVELISKSKEKTYIEADPTLERCAEPLAGTDDVWKTVVAWPLGARVATTGAAVDGVLRHIGVRYGTNIVRWGIATLATYGKVAIVITIIAR